MIPDIKVLNEIVKHLQGVLRIMDWDILLRLKTTSELISLYGKEAPNIRGNCTRDLKNHEAKIDINKDFVQEDEMLIFTNASSDWWYKTLVHELLHIVTARYEFSIDCVVDQLESQSLIDNLHVTMTVEYESVVEKLAKIFTSIHPLETVLAQMQYACHLKIKEENLQ